MTTVEHVLSPERNNGRAVAEKYSNSRISQLDTIGAPKPWVVDNSKGDDFWNKVKYFAIPLKIKKGISGIYRKEQQILDKAKGKYGNSVFMVLIPDDECFGQWSVRFIIPADLEKTWEKLLDESLESAREGNYQLSDMKRHAAMIITGWTDTK